MKCKAKRMYPLWGLLLSFSWWNVSCVDNQYNLDKDIDMTVNVGGEFLTLPVGSTDTAFLSKIIEVNEGDILQPDAATHVYHLTKSDPVNVKSTRVNQMTISGTQTDLEKKLVDNASVNVSSVSTAIKISNTLTATADHVDAALKELGALGTKNPAILTLNFGLKGSLHYSEVKAENLVVQFPSFLKFKEGEVEDGNRLVLNGDFTSKQLEVEGYEFGENAGEGLKPDANRSLTITGGVSMQGKVVTSGISGTGDLSLTLHVELSEMTADFVTGVIQPDIEVEAANIAFSDLPDFLKDGDTRLDIANPIILLHADNPLNTPVDMDAVLTPQKNNAPIAGHEVRVGAGYGKTPVTLNPGNNLIALSRTGNSAIEGAVDIEVSDINNLLEIIPNNIEVDLKPVVRNEEYYEVELGRSYALSAGYKVDVPLSFEQGLNIVYSDSIKDLNKDLKDMDKLTLKKVNLILSVDNAIPLKLQLKADNVRIKDVYGNELTAVKTTIEEDKQYVAESTDGEQPVASQLVLSLTSEDTAFLSKIDRICFKIAAVPGTAVGVPLKDTQWLKITGIKLSVPGGVNVDLN